MRLEVDDHQEAGPGRPANPKCRVAVNGLSLHPEVKAAVILKQYFVSQNLVNHFFATCETDQIALESYEEQN